MLIDELSTARHVFNPGPLLLWFVDESLVVELQEFTSGTAVDNVVGELALNPAAFVAEPGEFIGMPTASLVEPLLADIDRASEHCQRVSYEHCQRISYAH